MRIVYLPVCVFLLLMYKEEYWEKHTHANPYKDEAHRGAEEGVRPRVRIVLRTYFKSSRSSMSHYANAFLGGLVLRYVQSAFFGLSRHTRIGACGTHVFAHTIAYIAVLISLPFFGATSFHVCVCFCAFSLSSSTPSRTEKGEQTLIVPLACKLLSSLQADGERDRERERNSNTKTEFGTCFCSCVFLFTQSYFIAEEICRWSRGSS